MKDLIKRINSGEKLDFEKAKIFFDLMIKGSLTEGQTASALISLKCRGETPDELAALVSVLEKYKKAFHTDADRSVDTCGTGGDGKSTVNVSTAVSIILASMGYNVLKHGNTAQSGKVGSADILTEAGFDLNYADSSTDEFFKKHNYVFFLAPLYHPSLKGIGKVRKEIKVPTIFNFVGPLVNPGNPEFQIIGINKRERIDLIGKTVLKLGKNNITIYSSYDGYDEVSSKDKTECITIKNNNIKNFEIDPSDFFKPFDMPGVKSKDEAVTLFNAGLSGENQNITDIFALNTALAIKTIEEYDLKKGFDLAREHLKSGRAKEKLNEMVSS